MRWLNPTFLLLGVVFLAVLVANSDLGAIEGYLSTMGAGFALVIALNLLVTLVESLSWKASLGAEGQEIGLRRVLVANIAGQGINLVVPSNNAGEILKGKMLAGAAPGEVVVSSLVLYNFIYFLLSAAMVFGGAVVAWLFVDAPSVLTVSLLVTAVVLALVVGGMGLLLRLGLAERGLRLLSRFFRLRRSDIWLVRARDVDARIRGFRREHPRKFRATVGWMALGRILSVVEVLLICQLLGRPIHWTTAYMLQSASQVLYWALAFIPGQVGVMEEGSRRLFEMLRFDPNLGLAMELVRRGRKVFQVILSLSILLWVSIRPEASEK